MRHLANLALVACLIGVLAACSRAATPVPTPPAALPGTTWELGVQAGTAPAAQSLPTLTFNADQSLSGSTYCNRYSGSYTVDGSVLTISDLKVIKNEAFSCPPELQVAEEQYLAALAGVTAWQVGAIDPSLIPNGVVLAPVKLALTGTTTLVFSQS